LNTGWLVRTNIVRVIKAHLFAVLLAGTVLSILVANIYRAQDHPAAAAEVQGTLRGVHVAQGISGTTTLFSVALTNGEVVMVSPPVGTLFKENARVILVQRGAASGRESYDFKSYAL
jgi:hypothetical protein